MSDNEELKKEKARLQSQIDLLTARSYDQEQKIDSLFKMVNQLKCRVPKDPHEAEVQILTTTTPSPKKQGEVLAELPPSQEKRSASMPTNGMPASSVQNRNQKPAKPWHNVCKNFNRGICNRSNCKYEHKTVNTCRFYNSQSGCTKGLQCNFLHLKTQIISIPGMVTQDVKTKGRSRKENRNHQQKLMLSLS